MPARSWTVPLSLAAIGVIVLIAEAVRRRRRERPRLVRGAGGLGAALALGGRFEGVRAARGEGGDERDELIDLRAMAVAGGLAYVGAWAWLRRRS